MTDARLWIQTPKPRWNWAVDHRNLPPPDGLDGTSGRSNKRQKKKMTVDGPETERNIAAAASATTATTATTKMERQCHNLFIDRL